MHDHFGEERAEFPLWLELSGLPEKINSKARKHAWMVFKKIVELDCAVNLEPGIVEISLNELGRRTGLDPEFVEKCLNSLKRKHFIACFIPDNYEEGAFARVSSPLKTPVDPEELKKKRSDLFPPGKDFFRYHDQRPAGPGDDEVLKEIVDLYFNAIGLKMNQFVLDELRIIRQRFKLSDIKRAFENARRRDIRALSYIVRYLMAKQKKDGSKKKKKRRHRL